MLHANSTWSKAFNKVDGYFRKYNRVKYVGLFHSDEKYEKMFNRIRYHIMLKSNILDVYSHKYKKTKIKLDDDLPCSNTY